MNRARLVSRIFAMLFLTFFVTQAIPPAPVHATGESYALYWDAANANSLKDIFNDGEKQEDIGEQMTLFSRGGVFGEGYNLSFDPDLNNRMNASGADDDSDEYYASAQLYCKGGKVTTGIPDRPYYQIEYTAAFRADDWNSLRNQSNPRVSLGITRVIKIADPKSGDADEPLHQKGSSTGPGNLGSNSNNDGIMDDMLKQLDDIENFDGCLDALPRGENKTPFTLFYKLSDEKQAEIKAAIDKANADGKSGSSSKTEGADEDATPNCENTGSVLGFFMCPIIEGAASVGDTVFDSVVGGFLGSLPISSNPDNGGFKAWQAFRLIGNIVLIGALLGVVYYQTKGSN